MNTETTAATIIKSGNSGNSRGVLLLLVGALLVLFGGVLLLSAGLIALEILADPESVPIITLIKQQMAGDGHALYGRIGSAEFAIGIGEPLRTLLFLVLGVWVLSALVSILKALVLTGKELLAQGRHERAD